MRFAGEEKMLIAKRSAAVNEVLDYFIEESEIRHDVPLTRDRVSRWRGSRGGAGMAGGDDSRYVRALAVVKAAASRRTPKGAGGERCARAEKGENHAESAEFAEKRLKS